MYLLVVKELYINYGNETPNVTRSKDHASNYLHTQVGMTIKPFQSNFPQFSKFSKKLHKIIEN